MPQTDCPQHSDGNATCRLLEIAEQLFAEKGFRATSVRAITNQATCNIAAVNYHFGSKEKLYQAVFDQLLTRLREHRLAALDKVLQSSPEQLTLEHILRAFSEAFLEPMTDQSRSRRLMQLMMRENLDPHLPPATFAHQVVNPISTALQNALTRVEPNIPPQVIRLCILSLIGQLFQVAHIHLHSRDEQPDILLDNTPSAIVDHIVRFTAAGIRAYQQGTAK